MNTTGLGIVRVFVNDTGWLWLSEMAGKRFLGGARTGRFGDLTEIHIFFENISDPDPDPDPPPLKIHQPIPIIAA
jgi:hypothetical protein